MADWKKVAVSGSDVSQFNNDSGYITSATSNHAFATASFDGIDLIADSTDGTLNFTSGSGGEAGLKITATAGTDTLDFSLGANSVPNAALVNDLVTLGTTNVVLGAAGTTTIAGLVSITSQGFTGSLSSTSVLADGVTATTQTSGDNSTKVATTAFVAASTTAADLDLVGDGATTTDVDLDSQTLTFTGQDGLQLSASAQTITATIANGGIANAKLANSTISGKALGTNLDNLTVDDSTLNLDSGTTYNGAAARIISIKDGGVDTAAIADSLGTLGTNQFTGSFSGSFTGDGSELTGVTATTLGNALTVGTGLDFSAGSSFDGSVARQIDLDLTEVITTDGDNRVLTSDGDGTLTAEPNFLFDGDLLTVTGNELVTGNLTVQGTASFQNTTELQVADRFILMASGSNTAGDGGIVIQQGTQNIGEVFGFDSSTTRFGLTGSFNASDTAFTPDAFMATVVEGTGINPDTTPARYDKKGNMFVGTDQNIWIYGLFI